MGAIYYGTWMNVSNTFLPMLSLIKVISCSSRCVSLEWRGPKCFLPCLHSWHCNNKHERISETGETRVRRQALLPTMICWDRLQAAPVFVASQGNRYCLTRCLISTCMDSLSAWCNTTILYSFEQILLPITDMPGLSASYVCGCDGFYASMSFSSQ